MELVAVSVVATRVGELEIKAGPQRKPRYQTSGRLYHRDRNKIEVFKERNISVC